MLARLPFTQGVPRVKRLDRMDVAREPKPRKARRRKPAARAIVARAASPVVGDLTLRGSSVVLVAALLVLVVAVYAPVRHYGFVSFDDPIYVSENPQVADGFTWPAIRWAFTAGHAGYWIPVTWLSYMADVQVGAGTAGGHHAINVILHALNAVLLFGLLRRTTRATGPSLFVAALFAVHPLHVESVAWITERKDVLSTLFMMLAVWAYVGYVQGPSVARYALVTAAFLCSLMAKPIVVTLPLVLLLLDVWPLRRREAAGGGQEAMQWLALAREKVPLVALALACGIITFLAQRGGGAVAGLEKVGPLLRITTALQGYVTYIFKTIWPNSLAIFYPYSPTVRLPATAAALLGLTALSVFVLRFWRTHPFLAVGWFWYLITLMPVVGFLQAGMQGIADRFTYVPLIGLFMMIAWGVPALFPAWRRGLAVVAVFVVLICGALARAQVETWKDDYTVWQHALTVTPDNFLAHNSLGRLLYPQGRTGEAAWHFSEAVRLAPDFPDAHNNLAMILSAQGRLDDAIAQYREAVRLKPTGEELTALAAALARRGDFDEALDRAAEAVRLKPELAEAHYNLALTLTRVGRIDEALDHYAEARRLKPGLADVHVGLAATLVQKGRPDQAIVEYREALRLNGRLAEARHGLGLALMRQGNLDEAVRQLAEAVTLDTNRADFQNDLGFALAAQGKPGEAIPRFTEAIRLAPGFEAAHYHLGLALAGTGRFHEAVRQFSDVLRLNPNNERARQALAALPKQ
jgi:tetratricopeptide (TPR) repeat protein